MRPLSGTSRRQEPTHWVTAMLGVDPGRICLVACHVWDTIGAAAAGWQTGLILREGNARSTWARRRLRRQGPRCDVHRPAHRALRPSGRQPNQVVDCGGSVHRAYDSCSAITSRSSRRPRRRQSAVNHACPARTNAEPESCPVVRRAAARSRTGAREQGRRGPRDVITLSSPVLKGDHPMRSKWLGRAYSPPPCR